MRRELLTFGLLLLAGCAGDPPGQPREAAAPLAGGQVTTEIEMHATHYMSSGGCFAGGDSCLVGNPSSILLAILPNATLLSFDLTVTLPTAEGSEVVWNLPCLEDGCPRRSLASGHGVFPLEIHVGGLALSNAYLRLDLNDTRRVEENPNPINFAEVGIRGTARVSWGPALVETVRDLPFSFTTFSCLDPPTCNPLVPEHDEFDLMGVVTMVELQATWQATIPDEEDLRFYVICEVGCEDEYVSGDVSSPASVRGPVHLLGHRIWVGANVDHAGVVGGGIGPGTEIRGNLRLTELTVAT